MNTCPSAQIFERPKRSWLAQRKIWGQLQHAARAVHSPLAGLAFREPSSRRAFTFGIAGTLGSLGLLMCLSPSLGAKPKPVPKLPSIKLSTQLALLKKPIEPPKASPKPPPKDQPKPVQDNPAAQAKPKLTQDKPKLAQDKPKLTQDKPPKLAESSRPSSKRRRKPPKAAAPKRPPQDPPSPSPNLPEKTLDFSGQAAGMIQSSAGASAAGSGGMIGPGAAGGSGSGSGSGRSGKSLAQRAKVASTSAWNCAWPDAAIDRASNQERVLVEIKVDQRGKMIGGKVLDSPGYGFGQEALDCAKRQRYTPALDAKGRPVFGGRLKLRVRFKRNVE